MTKADLETALKNKELELNKLKQDIAYSLKSVIGSNESRRFVDNFCIDIGLPLIKQEITISVPYGVTLATLKDDEGELIEFEVISIKSV